MKFRDLDITVPLLARLLGEAIAWEAAHPLADPTKRNASLAAFVLLRLEKLDFDAWAERQANVVDESRSERPGSALALTAHDLTRTIERLAGVHGHVKFG